MRAKPVATGTSLLQDPRFCRRCLPAPTGSLDAGKTGRDRDVAPAGSPVFVGGASRRRPEAWMRAKPVATGTSLLQDPRFCRVATGTSLLQDQGFVGGASRRRPASSG